MGAVAGSSSVAIGWEAMAPGSYSTALGFNAKAGGYASAALGSYVQTLGSYSTALGEMTIAAGDNSFAAGYRAQANHNGAFGWADSQYEDFTSTANNQFLIRAAGGVGINKNNPATALDVNGTISATNLLTPAMRLNEGDIYFRGGGDKNHGLGWFGATKLFAGVNVDGPVLYGCDGGGLGVGCTPRLALRWRGDGNVAIDPTDQNNGAIIPGLSFGNGSGEGVASKRTSGGNQYGLDLYTSFTPRVSIANNGNVGIGTTSPAYKLHVNGSVAGVGAYNNVSDVRLKKDLAPLANALARVLALEGVSFDWDADEHPEFQFEAGRQIGFVAQQVHTVLPEAVTEGADGYLTVAYSKITPVLVEAMKEQQKQIEELKAQNAQLAADLTELKAMVEAMRRKQ